MAALKKTSKKSTLSAGILAYRTGARGLLLVHPCGPFWLKKDGGAWSIPKKVKSMPRKIQSRRPRDVSLPRNSAAVPRLVGCRP
jgi:hypothetical protein